MKFNILTDNNKKIFSFKQDFLMISKDEGYFKDNTIIHCSKSTHALDSGSLALDPHIHAPIGFVLMLDED